MIQMQAEPITELLENGAGALGGPVPSEGMPATDFATAAVGTEELPVGEVALEESGLSGSPEQFSKSEVTMFPDAYPVCWTPLQCFLALRYGLLHRCLLRAVLLQHIWPNLPCPMLPLPLSPYSRPGTLSCITCHCGWCYFPMKMANLFPCS